MSKSRAPEVATTRVLAETLGTLFAFGAAAGVCIAFGSPPGPHRAILLGLSFAALLTAAVTARWGPRWPRAAFHLPVVGATALITCAILVCPDPLTGFAAAILIAFVVIDAYLFFSGWPAVAHLLLAAISTNTALLADVGLNVPTVLGLDLVLIGLGTVTRRLVIRASSASRDPLTGLTNRRGFDDALRELMAEAARTGEPLSAALLDLDHFKDVNDTAGHEAGDRLLCRVADAWQRELPAEAVLARHGGDEFSLVLPGMDGDAALELVRRICTHHPEIPLSCGVAAHHPRETASQLMRRADRALYEAKDGGRGRAELDGAPTDDVHDQAVIPA